MSETLEHKVERLEDVVLKLETQGLSNYNKLEEENTRLRGLLERAKGQLVLTPGQRKSPLVREIEQELKS